jgi:diguanylate cyclase (GGDEF)-like protein
MLGPADGVLIEDYYLSSSSVGPDGRLYFGGPDGLTVIDAAAVRPWNYTPPLVVTEVIEGGHAVPAGRFSQLNPSAAIEIQPSANQFSVEFAALDYTAPEENQYEYRLAGFDRDWIKTDSGRRLAIYTNLRPGRYTLELRGSNRNGLWSATRRIPVRVLPAWYQTAWARIGFLLLAAGVLWGLFQLGRIRSTARQRELEHQVAMRTEELRQTQGKLEAMAYSDSLTGLANRRMFGDRFRQMLAQNSRQKDRFALLTFDIDRFKQVNDTYGHAIGDALLKEVTARLQPLMRESDCFARLGGDEFGVLASGIEDDEAVAALAAKIAGCFAEPVEVEGVRLTATFSLGAALYPEDGTDEEALMRSADAALYEVKREGRNGWRRFQASMSRSGDANTE